MFNLLKIIFVNLKFVFVLSFLSLIALSNDAHGQKPQTTKAAPVVLIHGIGGADLDYQPKGKGMWSNGFPNDVLIWRAGDPQNLQFDATGAPRTDTISKDVKAVKFYDVPGGKNITDLSKFLIASGYVKNRNLFEFAYDFRFSAVHNAQILEELINQIKSKNESAQIDIIAHSFGGLIAKQYLMKEENAANIGNLIFVGTPHLGAPKALKALRYGDNLEVRVIDGCKLKRVVHNLPGMFNLLPGRGYFAASGGGYLDDAGDIDGDGVRGVLDYEQTTFNLINGKESRCLLKPKVDASPFDKLSANLIEEHTTKFHEAQDNWKKPDGVRVFLIAGYGISTLKMLAENKNELKLTYTTEGDGTVPLWSAETADADEIYYLNLGKFKTDHARMIGDATIAAQILNLLRRGELKMVAGISKTRPDKKLFVETVK